MSNKAFDITKHKFSDQDLLLLDANIWLYLFPAPSSSSQYATRIYSAAFKAMKSANSNIYINALILSEYLNRYCRIEWHAVYRAKFPDFKKFRQSTDYISVGSNAAAFAKVILRNARKESDGFVDVDVANILAEFEKGTADFNDCLISESCAKKGMILVTHDGDFISGDIKILTDNRKLLLACPAPHDVL